MHIPYSINLVWCWTVENHKFGFPATPMRIAVTVYFLLSFLFAPHSQAQQGNYTPRKTYSLSQRIEITKTVDKLLDAEIRLLGKPASYDELKLNASRKRYFRQLVESNALIYDDTLQQLVSRVLKTIEAANTLKQKHRYVFLVKNPDINAHCLGNGVFLINVGMLARINTEDELAFALAHEIAHDELSHVTQKMIWLSENKFVLKQKERITNMINGTISLKSLEEFRKLNFAFSRINRQREYEADNAGFILYKNAGYREQSALDLLKALEEPNSAKYPIGLNAFLPLHCEEYPLQDYWLRPRLTVFSKKMENSFLHNLDSLSTHPEIPERVETLEAFFSIENHETTVSAPFPAPVIRIAEFEAVESAFVSNQYDKCLMQALMLLQIYPRHPYLIGRIAGIFLQLNVAKTDEMTSTYVRSRTVGYSAELKLFNNLLYNISAKEAGEIAFHLLSNPDNFDPQNTDHYYMLWKICELTFRPDMQQQLASDYKAKFKTGISHHNYALHTIRKLNIFDFYRQWGWVFL